MQIAFSIKLADIMLNKSDYTVVVTRATQQSQSFLTALAARGYKTISLPSIKIKIVNSGKESREVLDKINNSFYDWLVFSSKNGVESLYKLQQDFYKNSDLSVIPLKVKVAVQGRQTAETFRKLYARDFDLMPQTFIAESLLEDLLSEGMKDQKVLLAIAKETRGVLGKGLRDAGVLTDEFVVYETVAADKDEDELIKLEKLGAENLIFTFFSPSAVKNTLEFLGKRGIELLTKAKLVSIGPVTTKCMTELNLPVFLEARDHSEKGVLEILDNANAK